MQHKISVSAWWRRLSCCTALTLLSGCQAGGPEAAYRDYLSRLAGTLSVETQAALRALPPRPPRSGQLRLHIPAGTLHTLDFLALRGCALQATIGKRNSSLGRMARDSQRLLLELEYLRLAPPCIEFQREQGRDDLANTLQQAWLLKRRQLPARIFNATLGSTEYRAFWRRPAAGELDPGSRAPGALQAINQQVQGWLAGDYRAHNREFEILLSEVAAGDGGALALALADQAAWLAAADRMLARRMARGPLCSPGIRPAAAEILPKVIRSHFIGRIQPRAAALGRLFHQLLPAIGALEQHLAPVLPAPYLDWQQARNARLEQDRDAPRRHVAQLQALQLPCGQAPAD